MNRWKMLSTSASSLSVSCVVKLWSGFLLDLKVFLFDLVSRYPCFNHAIDEAEVSVDAVSVQGAGFDSRATTPGELCVAWSGFDFVFMLDSLFPH